VWVPCVLPKKVILKNRISEGSDCNLKDVCAQYGKNDHFIAHIVHTHNYYFSGLSHLLIYGQEANYIIAT
jgi:hypothetical protein